MNITEGSSINNYAVNNGNDDPLSLKKAIKAYRDEWLTGLTDEEIEKINEEAKKYLEAFPIKTAADREAFNTFIKSLLKKYGYKGDIDEYAAAFAKAAETSPESNQTESSEQRPKINLEALYQMESLGALSIKNKFLL